MMSLAGNQPQEYESLDLLGLSPNTKYRPASEVSSMVVFFMIGLFLEVKEINLLFLCLSELLFSL